MPLYDNIGSALNYVRDAGHDISPGVVINATSVELAAEHLESRLRASWRSGRSARNLRGTLDIHMLVPISSNHRSIHKH